MESKNKDEPSFRVIGIETEPQIAIQALKTACIAATKLGSDLLCLEKLCVRQDKATAHDAVLDNDWQVQNMHNIYSCVVMLGGLRRLAKIDEKTKWMERAWTLLEDLAPPTLHVLVDWDQGNCTLHHTAPIEVQEVVPGKAALVKLHALLEG